MRRWVLVLGVVFGWTGVMATGSAAAADGPTQVPVWVPPGAVANHIYTIAGNGNPGTPTGNNGDGGPATAAQLNGPRQMVENGVGDLFIADTGNNRVRRIDHATGIITTIAGNGNPGTPTGTDGDGGPGSAGLLNGPKVLAYYAGDLFITDNGNNRVRRIDQATGIITTIAGNGDPGMPTGNNGDGGPATAAQLHDPNGLAFGAGDLFITDAGNDRVRRVDLSTGIITTIAGNGDAGTPTSNDGDHGPAIAAQLNNPRGLAVTAPGDLLIADLDDNRVRQVDLRTGIITTIAGNGNPGTPTGNNGDGGPAREAQMNEPEGLALDGVGDILIADFGNARVRRIDHAMGIITTIAGDGNFGTPTGNDGDGGPATVAQLASANWLMVDAQGDVLIADTNDNRIRLVATRQRHHQCATPGRGSPGPPGCA